MESARIKRIRRERCDDRSPAGSREESRDGSRGRKYRDREYCDRNRQDSSCDKSKYHMSRPGGRAPRGRARGRISDQGNAHHSAVLPPTLQGVWAHRPGPQPAPTQPSLSRLQPGQQPSEAQPSSSSSRPVPAAASWQAHTSVGRATQLTAARGNGGRSDIVPAVQNLNIGAAGEHGSTVGRGAMRGGRTLPSNVLVTRPSGVVSKQGTAGTPLKLTANYFKLLTTTDWCLYQYRVDFAPEEERTVVRKGLLRPHRETIGPYIFDGTVLYTSNRLPEKMELFSTRVSDEAQLRVSIKEVGDLVKGDLHYLQFFNIIMRKCLGHLNLQLVGRDYYDARAKIEIRNINVELWPGYQTSIRQHERDVLMCSEISHKVMRQQTLYDILEDCRRNSSQDYQKSFSLAAIGQVVLTAYNNNTYRIDDIDYAVSPQSTFQLRNGESISYLDYYKNKYQIRIRKPTQPLLVSRTKPRERRAGQGELVYLVPELCRTTGITDDMRAQWQVMKALSDHMRIGPATRIDKLLDFNRRLRSEPKVVEDLKEWNLSLHNNLVEIPARKLDEQQIIFHSRSIKAGPDADWTRELRNNQMLSCSKLDNWAVVVPSRARRDVTEFISKLIQIGGGIGFQITQPPVYEIPDDKSQSYLNTIEAILSKVSVKLIFFVVPNNRPERYSAIKKKCCTDRPIPSQVFLAKNLTNRGLGSIATKVAIQMNCKIGGVPWSVGVPRIGLMVAGFDVCHDPASRGRDYGALVASLDPSFGQYFSAVSAHTSGAELSNDLSANMCKALHAYREKNQTLPERIVIYRDGVGEGQISYVYDHEVTLLKQRLAQVYGTQEVKMAFIIVTKRINTRLFMGKQNPPPGTVVDDVITSPERYDFFIVPQSVKQGSVSPTAFNVISDNIGLDANKLQLLTYKMTHMYFNWSGTIRVPAPCQYAHKLAFLVAQSLHRLPDTALQNLLYYL